MGASPRWWKCRWVGLSWVTGHRHDYFSEPSQTNKTVKMRTMIFLDRVNAPSSIPSSDEGWLILQRAPLSEVRTKPKRLLFSALCRKENELWMSAKSARLVRDNFVTFGVVFKMVESGEQNQGNATNETRKKHQLICARRKHSSKEKCYEFMTKKRVRRFHFISCMMMLLYVGSSRSSRGHPIDRMILIFIYFFLFLWCLKFKGNKVPNKCPLSKYF